ncbi:wall-associated receptor kinase 2-like protein [Corchorus capsularis]|uniref:Wall-associated receptor kinase 2-like protein n=1 Tax=Corchorus capsularis TaxID=210143 RepID=A0A1R3GS51_COCAP|nr:wall-associated receptor kinase 2-like protein [Corchorus capsularis]
MVEVSSPYLSNSIDLADSQVKVGMSAKPASRVIKLDRFNGSNYTRWKDKMAFQLTALKLYYILDPNLVALPEPTAESTEAEQNAFTKRKEDTLVCRGYILNSLSDRLYDLYNSMESPRDIWTALETTYQNEKKGTDKFLSLKYFEFKMSDEKPILDQVHELQVLVSKLKELEITIPDAIQIGAILSKMPPTWNDYRKKVLHSKDILTIDLFMTHLQIESENRDRDATYLGLGGDSKVNFVTEQKQAMKQMANLVNQESELVAMISEMHIGMITEVHMSNAAIESSTWWLDSGATIHICNNKKMFKTYEACEDSGNLLMGNHVTAKVVGKGAVEIKFTSG